MLARFGALCSVVFWAVMMGWLAWHDLWPAWTAQEPPDVGLRDLPTRAMRNGTGYRNQRASAKIRRAARGVVLGRVALLLSGGTMLWSQRLL